VTVVVFGSLNMDLVGHVPHFAGPGETVLGSRLEIRPGGKGANQAAVCAALGHATVMAGRVGDDEFGRTMATTLREAGADTTAVAVDPGPSGAALIELAHSGENSIVVLPGANATVGELDVAALDAVLAGGADLLLLQLELPLPAVLAAVRAADAERRRARSARGLPRRRAARRRSRRGRPARAG
jgi:ribokinase